MTKKLNKYYITFGQVHVHSVNGKTFDKDCLAEIEAETHEKAHQEAMEIFKGIFHNCHTEDELPRVIKYYPRGIIKVRGI
jgi:hypothetical protein